MKPTVKSAINPAENVHWRCFQVYLLHINLNEYHIFSLYVLILWTKVLWRDTVRQKQRKLFASSFRDFYLSTSQKPLTLESFSQTSDRNFTTASAMSRLKSQRMMGTTWRWRFSTRTGRAGSWKWVSWRTCTLVERFPRSRFFNGSVSVEGGRIKTWKRRWFILTDSCLYYFEFTTVSLILWAASQHKHLEFDLNVCPSG